MAAGAPSLKQTNHRKERSIVTKFQGVITACNKQDETFHKHMANARSRQRDIYFFVWVFFSSPFYAQTTIMRWHYYDINSTFIISKLHVVNFMSLNKNHLLVNSLDCVFDDLID